MMKLLKHNPTFSLRKGQNRLKNETLKPSGPELLLPWSAQLPDKSQRWEKESSNSHFPPWKWTEK